MINPSHTIQLSKKATEAFPQPLGYLQRELLEASFSLDLPKVKQLVEKGVRIEGVFDSAMEDSMNMSIVQDIAFLYRIFPAWKRYEETKEIGPELYPLFTQEGKWWGIGLGEGSFGGLEREVLDPTNLEWKDDRGDLHLLSSYVSESESSIDIPWNSISGDCNLFKAQSLYAPKLKLVGRGFFMNKVEVVSLPKLEKVVGALGLSGPEIIEIPNLREVGSDLTFWQSHIIDLKSLESVWGDVSCPAAKEAHLPKLRSTQSSLGLGRVEELELPALEEVGNFLEAFSCRSFHAPKLQSVRGHLDLRVARSVDLPKLREVGGPLVIDQLKFFKTSQLESISQSSRDWETKEEIRKECGKRKVKKEVLEKSLDL